MRCNYFSIPKLRKLYCWSLEMDKQFYPTLYQAVDYLSILELKANHVGKKGPHMSLFIAFLSSWSTFSFQHFFSTLLMIVSELHHKTNLPSKFTKHPIHNFSHKKAQTKTTLHYIQMRYMPLKRNDVISNPCPNVSWSLSVRDPWFLFH